MGNFGIGEKVKLINREGAIVSGAEIGTELTILGTDKSAPSDLIYNVSYINEDGDLIRNGCVGNRHIKSLKSKPSKKQRIETLEKEVSELKLIVHELRERKPSVFSTMVGQDLEAEHTEQVKQEVQRQTVPCSATRPPIEEVGEAFFEGANKVLNPKTANQLRAEVIEKAKGFVEEHKKERHSCVGAKGHPRAGEILDYENIYIVPKEKNMVDPKYSGTTKAEFIVNKEKRTVVALMFGASTKRLMSRGIAKCMPGDVFNEHIGKAIALGRALGLDVSEFEQAVQPTVAVGQEVYYKSPFMVNFEITTTINGFHENGEPTNTYNGGTMKLEGITIINDTNAIYGGVE